MVDSDIVVAIQNALAINQHIDSAMQSLVNAGYSREEVRGAASQAQFNLRQAQIPMSVPSPAELKAAPIPTETPITPNPITSSPTTPQTGIYKPLPTLNAQPAQMPKTPQKNKKFFIFLIILNIIALSIVTYLIIKLI